MKRSISLIFVIAGTVLSLLAQNPSVNSTKSPIDLELNRRDNDPKPAVHRVPIHLNIEAFYDSESHTIEILNNGNSEGETFLYLDDIVIDYNSEINTTFQIPKSGLYKIEIVTENWEAFGYIKSDV